MGHKNHTQIDPLKEPFLEIYKDITNNFSCELFLERSHIKLCNLAVNSPSILGPESIFVV